MPRLIDAPQRSDKWFEERLTRATASRFGDIMARTRSGYSTSRKNYAAEIAVYRLTGWRQPNFSSAAMQWGVDNEPVARLQYELTTGNTVEETGLWVHDEILAGASPDGFVDIDGCIEIKCPNTATHMETLLKHQLPFQYRYQVQGQMWITDRQWCDFVSFDPRLPDYAQMVVIRVERDDQLIADLESEIIDFLTEVEDQVWAVEKLKEK
jgi:putative phage-type endonuclease